MQAEDLPEELLNTVSPEDAIDYATGSGWQRNERVKDVALFSHPSLRHSQVLLPLTRNYDDYAYSIGKALARFAKAEDRVESQILNELLLPKSDILRFQVGGPNAAKGLLQVGEGVNLYNGVRESLLAAACGVLKPAKYYFKLARRAADDFLKTCWLGQTERGSYIATVSCPMNVMPEREADDVPFTRQATGLLVKSLSVLAHAINSNQEEKLLNRQDEEVVVSANLCEAIVAMQPKDEASTLSIRCSWAKALPPVTELPSTVRFRASQMETIEELAKALRPSETQDAERDYIGTIEKLQSEPNVADRTLGEITVLIAVAGVPRRVRVEIPPREYTIACDAHRDGNAVLIRGVLKRGVRLFRIENPRLFQMLAKS